MRNGEFLKLKSGVAQTKYIVEDLANRNRLVLYGATPGAAKSLHNQVQGYHVAYGAPFLGKKVEAGNVMFIDSENRYDILVERANRIKKGLEMRGYTMQGEVDYQHYTGFLLDLDTTWPPLVKEIDELQPCLIVLDHLACFHHADENRVDSMERIEEKIDKLMNICGSTVQVLHHFRKDDRGTFYQRLRGSGAIYAKSDTAFETRTLLVESDGNDLVLRKYGVIPQQRKEKTIQPIRVKIEEGADWLQLVHDGTFNATEDPIQDKLAHSIFHIFLGVKVQKSVNEVSGILAGMASYPETLKSLRMMESKGWLKVARREAHGAYVFEVAQNMAGCPWCGRGIIPKS